MHIITTLDSMAFGIAQKEELDSYEVKQKLVENINKLSTEDFDYLQSQMEMLVQKSVQESEEIDDKNVEKSFVSFLIRLYY
ncbi:MAG: hypothetical protein WA945_06810 [Arcobacteraceae bacterium]